MLLLFLTNLWGDRGASKENECVDARALKEAAESEPLYKALFKKFGDSQIGESGKNFMFFFCMCLDDGTALYRGGKPNSTRGNGTKGMTDFCQCYHTTHGTFPMSNGTCCNSAADFQSKFFGLLNYTVRPEAPPPPDKPPL